MANLYGYNTSTARKLSEADFSYGHNLHKESKQEIKPKTRVKAPKTAVKPQKGIKGLLGIALLFAMAFSVVSGYVSINESNNEISALKSEYNNIVASNQALQVKIDRAVDLKQLQNIAGEKYGMVSPERYQMFYVDLEMDDFSENTVGKEKSEKKEKLAISGVPGIITGTLNIFQ